ncbi:sensor histidine kinase [Spirillospora albida]|uniref:sensor histidine kinase n=1 Tax=Spirillospora albida TaxID=58123 RepID=UPI00069162B4|nr:HAMP domain-containing sensor histidine kinase [Spirillospora albida]
MNLRRALWGPIRRHPEIRVRVTLCAALVAFVLSAAAFIVLLVPRPVAAVLIGLGVPALTALTAFGAWLAVGRTLRPVNRMRLELNEITATDLGRRVPVPPRHDEVALLAESVNATLDRLERAVARQRAFVLDASHELRTPLTGLRMQLELALADPRDPEVPETLQAALASADRLAAVVGDLQAVARVEFGGRFPRDPVDLAALADQEVLRTRHRTRVTVRAEQPVVVAGGRAELARLLANLIGHADRRAATAVTVLVSPEAPGTAAVHVLDDGPPVAPHDRERLFERFTRLDRDRHRDAGGTGLGLAVARDIAEAHGGALLLADRPDGSDGACFVLRLPLAG